MMEGNKEGREGRSEGEGEGEEGWTCGCCWVDASGCEARPTSLGDRALYVTHCPGKKGSSTGEL